MTCPICKHRANDTPLEFPSKTEISTHLEHLALTSVDAINNRDFDRNSPAWSYKSPLITVMWTHPTFRPAKQIRLKEYLDTLEEVVEKNPEYWLTVGEFTTTVRKSIESDERAEGNVGAKVKDGDKKQKEKEDRKEQKGTDGGKDAMEYDRAEIFENLEDRCAARSSDEDGDCFGLPKESSAAEGRGCLEVCQCEGAIGI